MNEPDLITGIKNGDVQCFEELFIKYYSHFNQFIFRVGEGRMDF